MLDAFQSLRQALATLIAFCVKVEKEVDAAFAKEAITFSKEGKGGNKEYCEMWMNTSVEKFERYVRSVPGMESIIDDDAKSTMEVFPLLRRCRPAIWDIYTAAKRAKYSINQRKKLGGTTAAKEDEADNCNKKFPTDAKLTPGVYNLLCPHVVCYGFRVLTKAQSVEYGISIVLERFPKLPTTNYYDMACKMNRNIMRRVRPLFRFHCVRCFMDRPHGKGHTCSLCNFADAALKHTLEKASTAAESSHSIAIRFRPMLAYMKPQSFLNFKTFQVATAILRAIFKTTSLAEKKENDHVNFNSFFWDKVQGVCVIKGCSCSVPPPA